MIGTFPELMPPSDAKLWLDPNTVILPSSGWLHILNRRGLTKIQAEHIDEVHEKLKPYLDGNYLESELFSAVPAGKHSVLEKYFTPMSQAGALHRGSAAPENSALTIEEDQAAHSLLIRWNGKTVFVSLDGKDSTADSGNPPYDAYLLFVTPEQMEAQWKRIWRARKNGPHLLYVIEETEPIRDVMDARKKYAAWLVGCSRIDSWDCRFIHIYKLDKADSTLTSVFQAGLFPRGEAAKTCSIRFTSDVVKVSDHEQIPLVIAKAALPFCPNSVAAFGLRYDLLADDLAREFMVQATLLSEVACITEFKSWERPRAELRRTRVNPGEAATWPVADSLLHLRVRALEHFCRKLCDSDGNGRTREMDLSQSADKHPQVVYLAGVLRPRLHALPAQIRVMDCGLYVCQAGKHQAYSLIEAKAIRDVLLSLAREEFYPETLGEIESGHECDFPTFLADDALEQLVLRVNQTLDQQKLDRKFTFKHIQRCGVSAWTGTFGDGN